MQAAEGSNCYIRELNRYLKSLDVIVGMFIYISSVMNAQYGENYKKYVENLEKITR